MSGHADTIRRYMRWGSDDDTNPVTRQEAWTALDALLAENQRYEKALRYIADFQAETEADAEIVYLLQGQAREALAGDTE